VLLQLRLHNGLTTNFKSRPDLYVGGVQIAAYITPKSLVHVMRVGILADGFYSDKKLQAGVGPTISIKLKTFKSDPLGRFGSVGNIHLSADHLWGTGHYKLIGGGLGIEAGFLNIGFTTHRDYYHNTWWFQTHVGIRLSKKKFPQSIDERGPNNN
ncbi:MAG: hypothetical protein ABIN97_16235, partial [Ginsengibacter sp.]